MFEQTEADKIMTGLLPRHHGSRILLAEDNAINREVAVTLLSSAGLKVDTAENDRGPSICFTPPPMTWS